MAIKAEEVTIYGLQDPRDSRLRYVGKSKHPEVRLNQHMMPSHLAANNHKNNWLRGLKGDGLTPHMIALEVTDSSEADEAEKFWIQFGRSLGCALTNGTDGGEGAPIGRTHTEDEKTRMRESAKLRGVVPPHHVGELNPRAVLSDAEVRTVRERSDQGERGVDLAREYGVTAASISLIVTGQTRLSAGGPTRSPHAHTKLTDSQIAKIRGLVAGGLSQREVARRFNVDPSHVSRIASPNGKCRRR